MDYNQEDLYRMTSGSSRKMPFYMTYPMQNVFLEEVEYERDMERLKSMYPQNVRTIQEMVEEECDKMEHEGSVMFDEYPDRLMLRQICERVYMAVMEQEGMNAMQSADFEKEQYEPVVAEELQMVGRRGSNRPQGRPPHHGRDGGLDNLIEVLLFNEMHNRRCRHRRCRRWW